MQSEIATQIAKALIQAYPPDRLSDLLSWSQAVLSIRQADIPAQRKLLEIARVTRDRGVTGQFLKHFGRELRRVGWDQRTRTMRGVIGGAGAGLLASVFGPMAGIAAFGGAVGVPFFLLTAGAGAIFMAIVDEMKREE